MNSNGLDPQQELIDDDPRLDELASIPVTLTAYIATRSVDAAQTTANLVERCARTPFWTVVVPKIEALLGMTPCRMGESLLVRRSGGVVSAAIVCRDWSTMLRGDEAWIDVVATSALALAYLDQPIRTGVPLPFLSQALIIRDVTQVGSHYRFYCSG
jgi:hypothetical protein